MPVITPVIPTNITVHLGAPDAPAENITVPYTTYLKNVASGEIYPTWPEESLKANIYAINNFALNRIYTEWYPSKGYPFDITSTTAYDQSFAKNREVFENISQLVDEQFNNYIVRQGEVQPLFTPFCNGTTSTCPGLSQWGTVTLADQGKTAFEILQYYYGDNITPVSNAPVQNIEPSYPGRPLRIGDAENAVAVLQNELNRIRQNFPAIPLIPDVFGIFDDATESAVRSFQQIFNLPVNGTVDKATWYRIKEVYNGVKRLGELSSEGLTYAEATLLYPELLEQGMSGPEIGTIQYLLNVIAYFNPNINLFPISYVFDTDTLNAVNLFQQEYGLPVTGKVDQPTYDLIVKTYRDILRSQPPNYTGGLAKLYPGYFLTPGMVNTDVRDLQTYLSVIAENNPEVPPVAVDGVYGPETRDAVYVIQRLYGLPLTGTVGPLTWRAIADAYDAIIVGQ